MFNSGMFARSVTFVAAIAAVAALVTSCGSSTGPTAAGPGMMGGAAAGGNDPTVAGQGMMGAESGYGYSRSTCSAPTSLPGSTVNVVLGDMGMTQMMGGTAPLGAQMTLRATPASVPTGQVSLVVSNMGWRTHEVVILPLAAGAAAGQRVPDADGEVDETGSLGEVSHGCQAGAGDGITAGAVGWGTVTLAPGRYELVCNLQNHYANGMYQELVVT